MQDTYRTEFSKPPTPPSDDGQVRSCTTFPPPLQHCRILCDGEYASGSWTREMRGATRCLSDSTTGEVTGGAHFLRQRSPRLQQPQALNGTDMNKVRAGCPPHRNRSGSRAHGEGEGGVSPASKQRTSGKATRGNAASPRADGSRGKSTGREAEGAGSDRKGGDRESEGRELTWEGGGGVQEGGGEAKVAPLPSSTLSFLAPALSSGSC
eukprot:2603680-Rhodomonas_salina.4